LTETILEMPGSSIVKRTWSWADSHVALDDGGAGISKIVSVKLSHQGATAAA